MKIKYTEEQKQNAVQMLIEQGPHKTRATLGIPTNTLYRWKKQLAGKAADDDSMEAPDVCDPEDEIPAEDLAAQEESINPQSDAEEEQPRKQASLPEIEAVISRYFIESFENRPEIFVNSIIMAVKNIFKENESLVRENTKLKRTLRAMLEE